MNDGGKNPGEMSRYRYRIPEMFVLPFPVADIEANRVRLCDHCFSGGPVGLCATL